MPSTVTSIINRRRDQKDHSACYAITRVDVYKCVYVERSAGGDVCGMEGVVCRIDGETYPRCEPTAEFSVPWMLLSVVVYVSHWSRLRSSLAVYRRRVGRVSSHVVGEAPLRHGRLSLALSPLCGSSAAAAAAASVYETRVLRSVGGQRRRRQHPPYITRCDLDRRSGGAFYERGSTAAR